MGGQDESWAGAELRLREGLGGALAELGALLPLTAWLDAEEAGALADVFASQADALRCYRALLEARLEGAAVASESREREEAFGALAAASGPGPVH